ncbi:hypothetical protein EYF80_013787 [Liparis tanakae]|uniref:Uncharacterized protein n=1 Tax=Liparis tanakae TaxID=230148 RepID=A0A4Z2IEZ7_9TELE|nr:hypothetical protein EYF80_013787 [Liparis tanakae]
MGNRSPSKEKLPLSPGEPFVLGPRLNFDPWSGGAAWKPLKLASCSRSSAEAHARMFGRRWAVEECHSAPPRELGDSDRAELSSPTMLEGRL